MWAKVHRDLEMVYCIKGSVLRPVFGSMVDQDAENYIIATCIVQYLIAG